MNSKTVGIAIILLFVGAPSLFACIMDYTLVHPDGSEEQIVADDPDQAVELITGITYILRTSYRENHRNCSVTPDDTIWLLDGSRWRESRDTQALLLESAMVWTQTAVRTNTGELTFTAQQEGMRELEVIRVCDRDGYHGMVYFLVEQP